MRGATLYSPIRRRRPRPAGAGPSARSGKRAPRGAVRCVARAALAGALLTALPGFLAPVALAQEPARPVLALPPAVVRAEPEPASPAPRTIGGTQAAPCVQVDVAGNRAGHLECASRVLEDAARVARREAEAARNVTVPQAGSPDVQVGVASRAGTRLRLRENFGVSIRPPAVAPPAYPTPVRPR